MKINRPAGGISPSQEPAQEVKSTHSSQSSQQISPTQRDSFVQTGFESIYQRAGATKSTSSAEQVFSLAKALSQGALSPSGGGVGSMTLRVLAAQLQDQRHSLQSVEAGKGESQTATQQEKIQDLASRAVSSMNSYLGAKIHDIVQGSVQNLQSPLLRTAERVAQKAAGLADPGFFKNLGSAVVEGFSRFFERNVSLLKTGLLSWIRRAVPGGGDPRKIMSMTARILGEKVNRYSQGILQVGKKLRKGVRGIGKLARKSVRKLGKAVGRGISKIGKVVTKAAAAVGRTAQSVIEKVGAGLKAVLGRIAGIGNAAVSSVLNSIKAGISKVGAAVGKGISFVKKVAGRVTGLVGKVGEMAQAVAQKAVAFAKSAARSVAAMTRNVVGKIVSYANAGVSALSRVVKRGLSQVTRLARKAADRMGQTARGIASLAGKIVSFAGRAANTLGKVTRAIHEQQTSLIGNLVAKNMENVKAADSAQAKSSRSIVFGMLANLSELSIIPLPV